MNRIFLSIISFVGAFSSTLHADDSTSVSYVYNLPMTNLTSVSQLSSDFKFQYSYKAESGYTATNPNPNYYSIAPQGLEFNLYKGDGPLKKGSNTYPRTELRGLATIQDNIPYVLSFDYFIAEYPGGSSDSFDFCWMQIFGGNGPNIMLRWRTGTYELLCKQGGNPNLHLPGALSADIGVWTNWRVEFLLATSGGYVRVYRNDVLLGQTNGNTSGGVGSYYKTGIYAQQMPPPGQMKTYLRNLVLSH